jgi:hypothetical protein
MKLKYKVYNTRNVNENSNVLLGRASIKGFRHSNEMNFYWHFNKNVKDTFLFTSIVGSKNVRIKSPSTTEPYIQFDTRFYNFYNTNNSPSTFFVETSKQSEVVSVYFKSVTTDGSVFIKQSKNDKFLWNGQKFIADDAVLSSDKNTCVDGVLRLLTPDYRIVDNEVSKAANFRAFSFIKSVSKNRQTGKVSFTLKKLAGSKCIKVKTVNNKIKIEFDKVNCPCGNILNPSSSSSSNSSSSNSSSSTSNSSSSKSSSSKSSNSSSSSSSSLQKSQSSQSSMSYCSCDYPICTENIQARKATVINSVDGCVPNGEYKNIFIDCCRAIWESVVDPRYKIYVNRDPLNGNWLVELTIDDSLIEYNGTLPPDGLSCAHGYVEGIAAVHLVNTDVSSTSQSYSSDSTSSSSESSSSELENLYKKYFVNCDRPECSSEYYCVYEMIDEWVCSDELFSSSSSTSHSSSSTHSSSSSTSESSNSTFNPVLCPPTIAIIFG